MQQKHEKMSKSGRTGKKNLASALGAPARSVDLMPIYLRRYGGNSSASPSHLLIDQGKL
jgi:hypothetical protein